jgi:hypothetical protein
VGYVAYLGQQAYRFTDNDGTPAQKSVDWFLFTTTDTTATALLAEGFVAAQWCDFPDALTARIRPWARGWRLLRTRPSWLGAARGC